MDVTFIRGLEINAIIGIHPHERVQSQRILIDVEMFADTRKAALSKDIRDAVDYQAVSQYLRTEIKERQYLLVESLANELAEELLIRYPLSKIVFSVTKPDALDNVDAVGVKIVREK